MIETRLAEIEEKTLLADRSIGAPFAHLVSDNLKLIKALRKCMEQRDMYAMSCEDGGQDWIDDDNKEIEDLLK